MRLVVSVFVLSVFFILIIFPNQVKAQHATAKDTIVIKRHSAKKATLFSAVIPGLGQAYNKKYWKIPIIYGGFIGLYCSIDFNSREYNKFKDAYSRRIAGDTSSTNFPYYTTDNLISLRNYYRRNLELTYILSGLLYILNIVDASVDAHLFDFNINNDLSMHVEPFIYNNYNPTGSYSTTGVKLTFRF